VRRRMRGLQGAAESASVFDCPAQRAFDADDPETGAAAGGLAAMPLTRAFAERDWQVARNSDPNVMRLGTGQSLISGKNAGKV
jgi:hypothetical protein